MKILNEKTAISEINGMGNYVNGFVKGVVDIKKRLVAIDAEMHYELSDYLKEEMDSDEIDMWGFNLWLENEGIDDVLEFDSLINIHNNQLHGFIRGGMSIESEEIREKAKEVISEWIQF